MHIHAFRPCDIASPAQLHQKQDGLCARESGSPCNLCIIVLALNAVVLWIGQSSTNWILPVLLQIYSPKENIGVVSMLNACNDWKHLDKRCWRIIWKLCNICIIWLYFQFWDWSFMKNKKELWSINVWSTTYFLKYYVLTKEKMWTEGLYCYTGVFHLLLNKVANVFHACFKV